MMGRAPQATICLHSHVQSKGIAMDTEASGPPCGEDSDCLNGWHCDATYEHCHRVDPAESSFRFIGVALFTVAAVSGAYIGAFFSTRHAVSGKP